MVGGTGSRPDASERAEAVADADDGWQGHPSVNTSKPCPWCGCRSLHEQHCKQICLSCGWYQSCSD